MTQHSGLSPERWSRFTLAQQILMIGNEMNRAGKLPSSEDERRNSYARVLQLTDLTIAANDRPPLRRELLRWRDVAAELYLAPVADAGQHRMAFRCLLLFTSESARQIPELAQTV